MVDGQDGRLSGVCNPIEGRISSIPYFDRIGTAKIPDNADDGEIRKMTEKYGVFAWRTLRLLARNKFLINC